MILKFEEFIKSKFSEKEIMGIQTPVGVVSGTNTHIKLIDGANQTHEKTWEDFRAFILDATKRLNS